MRNIFDSHAHYDSEQFDSDREQLLGWTLPEKGVTGIVNMAANLESCQTTLELTRRYDFIWGAAGVHPEDARDLPEDWLEQVRRFLEEPKMAAVGEIGLDHHWPLPAREQYDLFEAQLQLAAELDLPVSVHDREAHAETYELLKKYRPRGVLHCYSGSPEDAAWLVAQGMHLGFGGAVTYKGAKRAARVLAAIDRSAVVLETDCPYMAPEPVRGRRNDSRNIIHVAGYIAGLWEMDAQAVLDTCAANARRVFGVE